MNQYKTVEVLEKIESEVNSKPVVVSLEVQCKINEEGKKSFPYPVLKVNINGRDQFFFIDIAVKIHELMGALMPKALEEKEAADAAFRARKEKWESQNKGQDDRGGGRKVGTHGGRKDSNRER
ncbi:hypothetical protein MUP59_04250 [Candidatus Bathyarchaeota archaeon]|nr:hypothetical protein [Candidatus Bathyarchaeota archaeon]